MSGSLPSLQQHAEADSKAFCQRFSKPRRKHRPRGTRPQFTRTQPCHQRPAPSTFYRPRQHRASHPQCIPFPMSGDTTLMKGVPRDYELYEPQDFLAEVTQHIVTSFPSLRSTGASHLFYCIFCRVPIKESTRYATMASIRTNCEGYTRKRRLSPSSSRTRLNRIRRTGENAA